MDHKLRQQEVERRYTRHVFAETNFVSGSQWYHHSSLVWIFIIVLYGLAKLNNSELTPNQREVTEIYASGKDVFFCSPAGSWKSLKFELAPFVLSFLEEKTPLPSLSRIVVSPLVSLMRTRYKDTFASYRDIKT